MSLKGVVKVSDKQDDFIEHLENFVNALIAISPSRNYLTQFLYIIYETNGRMDYTTLHDAFPDLLKQKETRDTLSKLFGISFGSKVTLGSDKYGYKIASIVDYVFNLFSDENIRQGLRSLSNNKIEVPNLEMEWIECKLNGAVLEPTYKNELKTILQKIKEKVSKNEYITKDDLVNSGFDKKDVEQCVELLSNSYALIEVGSGNVLVPSKALKKYIELIDNIK